MQEIRERKLVGERALFGSQDLVIEDCIFEEGESPLKECSGLRINGSMFRWKYPLWYCKDVKATYCAWMDMARAGVWYTNDVTVEHAMIQAPKNFRRCENVTLNDVTFSNAQETLWSCRNVKMQDVAAKGDYFAMNSSDMEIEGFALDGNYSFDGVKNVVIRNAKMLSKDAFWNSENVTVYDSFITGEYLGWNSKNLTLINCTIESLQGMCYVDNLVMKNCKLINTTLAFEYSSVDAEITSAVDSVLNPGSGTIRAREIRELIIERDRVDADKTRIVCDAIGQTFDRPEWLRG